MREKGTVGLSRAHCTCDENNEEPAVQHRPRSLSRMENLAAIVTIASSGCLERTGWREAASLFMVNVERWTESARSSVEYLAYPFRTSQFIQDSQPGRRLRSIVAFRDS